ncbi:MAG: cytochrome c [Acidobacteria bacterium]|nr:MAG: cytochrome c [Acidobacteriota bacterium]
MHCDSRGILRVLWLVAVVALVPSLSLADDAGKVLFDRKCAMCHGVDGVAKNMAAGSANLNDPEWQEANSAESIVTVITEGKGRMKGYDGRLTEAEIKQIADYVKTLK